MGCGIVFVLKENEEEVYMHDAYVMNSSKEKYAVSASCL
jgi:hypothetical protein